MYLCVISCIKRAVCDELWSSTNCPGRCEVDLAKNTALPPQLGEIRRTAPIPYEKEQRRTIPTNCFPSTRDEAVQDENSRGHEERDEPTPPGEKVNLTARAGRNRQ